MEQAATAAARLSNKKSNKADASSVGSDSGASGEDSSSGDEERVAPAKSASKSKRAAAAAPKEKKSTAPKEVMTLYMHFLCIHDRDLIAHICGQGRQAELPLSVAMPLSVEMETGPGPWKWYQNKGNSTTMQRYLVPWLIALHGLGFSKQKTTTQIAEMIVALCDEHKFLQSETSMSAEKAAVLFSVGFQDVCRKALFAAGKTMLPNYIFVSP